MLAEGTWAQERKVAVASFTAIRSIIVATRGGMSPEQANEILFLVAKGQVRLSLANLDYTRGEATVYLTGARKLSEIEGALKKLPYVENIALVEDAGEKEAGRQRNEKVE